MSKIIMKVTTARASGMRFLTGLLRVDNGDLEPQLLQPVVQLQHLRLILGEGQTRFTAVYTGHGLVGLTHVVCWRRSALERRCRGGLLICRIDWLDLSRALRLEICFLILSFNAFDKR